MPLLGACARSVNRERSCSSARITANSSSPASWLALCGTPRRPCVPQTRQGPLSRPLALNGARTARASGIQRRSYAASPFGERVIDPRLSPRSWLQLYNAGVGRRPRRRYLVLAGCTRDTPDVARSAPAPCAAARRRWRPHAAPTRPCTCCRRPRASADTPRDVADSHAGAGPAAPASDRPAPSARPARFRTLSIRGRGGRTLGARWGFRPSRDRRRAWAQVLRPRVSNSPTLRRAVCRLCWPRPGSRLSAWTQSAPPSSTN